MRGDEAKAEKEAARVGRELDGVDGRGDRVGQQLERVLRPRRRRARRVVAVARRLGALTLLAHPVYFESSTVNRLARCHGAPFAPAARVFLTREELTR